MIQGVRIMTKIKLQLTEFQIEKLKNVVNVGQSSAYQILTSPGSELGTLGRIAGLGLINSVNDDKFSQKTTATVGSHNQQSWFRKALRALR